MANFSLQSLREILNKTPKSTIEPMDYLLMFSSDRGTRVLAHILYEHHVFEEITDPEEIARRNVAIRMLTKAGILKEDTMLLLAKALLEVGKMGTKLNVQIPDGHPEK